MTTRPVYYTCPFGWTPYVKHRVLTCLRYIGVSDLSLASFKCAALQASLPHPKDSQQNKQYSNLFIKLLKQEPSRGLSTNLVAIDLNDVNREGVFTDLVGSFPTWYNWAYGEPNNFENKDYVVMKLVETATVDVRNSIQIRNSVGKWYAAKETRKVDVFCEMVANVPTGSNPFG